MTEIVLHQTTALDTPITYSADKHPALVYLASLATSSRRPHGQGDPLCFSLASCLRPTWDGLPNQSEI